jgi:hypothetical protein
MASLQSADNRGPGIKHQARAATLTAAGPHCRAATFPGTTTSWRWPSSAPRGPRTPTNRCPSSAGARPAPALRVLCCPPPPAAALPSCARLCPPGPAQVGACIVDAANVICGIGYNGFPRGCPDSRLPWAKRSAGGNPLDTKYPYVCHAEMNALLNKNGASAAGAVSADAGARGRTSRPACAAERHPTVAPPVQPPHCHTAPAPPPPICCSACL